MVSYNRSRDRASQFRLSALLGSRSLLPSQRPLRLSISPYFLKIQAGLMFTSQHSFNFGLKKGKNLTTISYWQTPDRCAEEAYQIHVLSI